MDQDQQQQQSPPQQSDTNNALEHRLNEMAAVVEEMRRQQSEMQNEMQRQAALHELDRKRWHEECRQMQEERERLLKQAVATASPQKSQSTKKCHSACRRIEIGPSMGVGASSGLLATSRVIAGSSKPSSPNRPRSFHTLSDGFREKLLEIVREKRHALASELQRYKQAVETDQTARALDTLSLSEQTNRPNPTTSPLKLPSFPEPRPRWNLSSYIEDISKQRRMQQQLASVLHAQNCTSEEVDSMGNPTCPTPFCSVTTKVLEHMRSCTFVTRCPIPMCSLTREVMQHYKNCQTNGCQICQPVKLESTSTQEQLVRFMDTICKGLGDDEVPVEAPPVPSIVDPTGAGLFSLANATMPNIFVPTFLPPMTIVAEMKEETEEVKMEGEDAQD